MKRNYQKPEIQVVNINHSVQLLAESEKYNYGRVTNVKGGIFELGGGSSESGRSRGCDDDWDEEDW